MDQVLASLACATLPMPRHWSTRPVVQLQAAITSQRAEHRPADYGCTPAGRVFMVDVIDRKAEFEKLTMLTGLTPTSTDGERAKAFCRVAQYRDGAIFTAKFAGKSAWERHPQGDEIVQIVD